VSHGAGAEAMLHSVYGHLTSKVPG
jgi:hypothetical protein